MQHPGIPHNGFRSTVSAFFLAMVFVLIVMPNGSIGGINIKLILFFAFIVLLVSYLIHGREFLTSSELALLGLFSCGLALWTIIGILQAEAETSQIFLEVRDIATTILISMLTVVLVRRRIIAPNSLMRTITYSVATVSIAKIVLISLPALFNINPIQALQVVIGEDSFITGDMDFGLFRIQFPTDIMGPFVLFILLAPTVSGIHLNRLQKLLISIVVISSGIIAYSRYIWFLYVAAFLIAMLIEKNWRLMTGFLIIAAVFSFVAYESLSQVLNSRFLSSSAESSDEIRFQELHALSNEFMENPILGKGMGGYAKAIVTNPTRYYSYELQWLSFLVQFGIVGLLGIASMLWLVLGDLRRAHHPAQKWVGLLFLFWLLSGFTNPYMTTSFAGCTFALFIGMFYQMRHRAQSGPSSLPPIVLSEQAQA